MIEPFVRTEDNTHAPGVFVPEPAKAAEWFFTEPSVATREYNGHYMRLTNEGWQFWDGDEWTAVYSKVKLWHRLVNRDAAILSPFLFVEEFEQADVEYTNGEYPLGEYWLIPPDDVESWRLIPVDSAEQLSNINALAIHELEDPVVVFNTLQLALAPLRDEVYGVIFTHNNERARIRPRDFDWTEYDS